MATNIDPAVEKATEAFRGKFARLREEIGKAIVGHTEIVEGVLTCLFAGGNVLLEGVPGVAKTTLAKAFAGALGVTVRRIQFTPDLLPGDILGSNLFNSLAAGGVVGLIGAPRFDDTSLTTIAAAAAVIVAVLAALAMRTAPISPKVSSMKS